MRVQELNGAIAATSAYFNGHQVGVNVTATLPQPTPAISEVQGAGGTVEVPVHTKVDPMACTLTAQGIDEACLKNLTPEPGDLIINMVQTTVSADGSSVPKHYKAWMRAVPKGDPSIEATYGETSETQIEFSVFVYKLYVDGVLSRHIDPLKGIYKVNGKDYAAEVTAMI